MNNVKTRRVAILGGSRIPFCRVNTDYSEVSAGEMLTAALVGLVQRFGLKGKKLGDVALGSVFPHPSGWNHAREAVLASGLAPETPAFDIARACATSLDASIAIANKIALGKIEVGVAGGVDSASDIPVFLHPKFARRLVRSAQGKDLRSKLSAWSGLGFGDVKLGFPGVVEKTTKKSMGQHCELMAQEWKISRVEQDAFAYRSHMNGAKAYKRGFYDSELVEFHGVKKDNCLRESTSIEKLAKLSPAFERSSVGSLTAGNSSPLTDGAATVLLASEEWAAAHKIPVLAYLRDYHTCAIDMKKEGLLMAPAYAVSEMLGRLEMGFSDFNFFEIHEAFAAQVLCTLAAWESRDFCTSRLGRKEALGKIDPNLINTVGSSLALGHPFAATGARVLGSLAKLLSEKGSGRGLISICTGGGMGTAAVIER